MRKRARCPGRLRIRTDVEEASVRVEELEEERLDNQRIFMLCLRPVIFWIEQSPEQTKQVACMRPSAMCTRKHRAQGDHLPQLLSFRATTVKTCMVRETNQWDENISHALRTMLPQNPPQPTQSRPKTKPPFAQPAPGRLKPQAQSA